MKKHAYLIIAHNNFILLEKLLSVLDDPRNDIYLHLDAKIKHIDLNTLRNSVFHSRLLIFQRYKITWGGTSSVQCELFLLRTASRQHYEYYHLISGCDFPLQSQDRIHSFFQQNRGREFIQFNDRYLNAHSHIYRRVALYHLLQDYKKCPRLSLFHAIIDFTEKSLLLLQQFLGINRLKNTGITLKYGSNWFSITDALAHYLLDKEAWILKFFCRTSCADELFLQTTIYASPFMSALYDTEFDGNTRSNMRLIDFERSQSPRHPHTWTIHDYQELVSSGLLFARKFSEKTDYEIIERLYKDLKAGRLSDDTAKN